MGDGERKGGGSGDARARARRWAFPATLPSDLLASVVVFLVALPLCMGIAVASGVPPALGLVTGIVGGLVVGVLAGSPLQVSGPAAGLTVLVWQLVQSFGIKALAPAVALAGALQITGGLVRIGRWFRAVPPSVIHGMLAGIGILIVLSQFHVMLDDKPRGTPIENLLSIPAAIWRGIQPSEPSIHRMAAALGILTILTLVAWNAFAPKKVKALPGALVGVVVATGVAQALRWPVQRVSVPDNLLGAANWIGSGSFGLLSNTQFIIDVIALAVIASAETLLCATAVDRMHNGPRTNYDRELWAQGIGNVICGVFGALPMTGVIVRSSANVQAGGKTRASAVLHGLWLLLLVVAAPFVLRAIPVASLAAVLVFTGYKLINPAVIKTLRTYGRGEVLVYATTIIAIVATDLLKGIVIGVLLSVAKLIYRLSKLQIRTTVEPEAKRTTLHLSGSATFLRTPELTRALEAVDPSHHLSVDLEDLDYIDHACLDTLGEWEKQHKARGGDASIHWHHLDFLCQAPAAAVNAAKVERMRQKANGDRDRRDGDRGAARMPKRPLPAT